MTGVDLSALTVQTLPTLRAALVQPDVELPDDLERSVHVVDAEAGVTVRVIRPRSTDRSRPCLYSMHGGGYVAGLAANTDAVLARRCARFGIVGVSVEYRLAPEAPYPAPLDDCFAGLEWTFASADEFGIDRTRIGITGVSAGGGLAAALALRCRDDGGLPLRFQVLECPMLDDRQRTPSSRDPSLEGWTTASNEFGWRCYLGARYGVETVPAEAAMARCEDLVGLPPAFVGVSGGDGFRDEDVLYALALSQAGVPTELHLYPEGRHGVHLAGDSATARQWERDVDEWLVRQIADR